MFVKMVMFIHENSSNEQIHKITPAFSKDEDDLWKYGILPEIPIPAFQDFCQTDIHIKNLAGVKDEDDENGRAGTSYLVSQLTVAAMSLIDRFKDKAMLQVPPRNLPGRGLST